ncbi:MAG: SnoaL-like domain protein [Actinomycetia bacterium]|nr:SnoaL-like domain protein [Actinomycetes bacterium]
MSDVEDVRRVVVRAAHSLDDKDWDAFGALFTDDARYKVHALDLSGRATIVDTLAPLMAEAITKHLLGFPLVEVDGDSAQAWSDMTTFAGPKGAIAVATIGRYHDTLVRTADGWRLASRVLLEL